MKEHLIEVSGFGKTFKMTAEEVEAAYRHRLHEYMLDDAYRQLNDFCFGVDDIEASAFTEEELEEELASFNAEYGFSFQMACKIDFLEAIVYDYTEHIDCNISENEQWEQAIRRVLKSAKEEK